MNLAHLEDDDAPALHKPALRPRLAMQVVPLRDGRSAATDMGFVRADDLDAHPRVTAHNARLVSDIARRYSEHGVDLAELIREGNRGLAHAMSSFELGGYFQFAVYATRCVCQHIECAIMSQMEPE